MALYMTMTTTRLTLVVGLSVIMASCSTSKGPSAVVESPDTTASSSRFRPAPIDTQSTSNTVAVPRAFIDSDQIEPDAPEAYTVVRGDTLWDISDRFLKEPWRWTEIWGYNPQIYNPHLIFPGDELALEYVNGKPSLTLTRDGKTISPGIVPVANTDTTNSRVKLSPKVRSESLDDAIPMISSDSISQFLVHPRVLDKSTITNAPYVIANSDDRLISSIGTKIYVRGPLNRAQTHYSVFRKNKELIDPVNGAHLGFEVTHVSDAKLMNIGDPSTLALTSNNMETTSGDIVLPAHSASIPQAYTPRMPKLIGDARIVSLVNAISQSGRNQVVVLNVGSNSNIQQGDVLAVETRGKSVVDRKRSQWERVDLPDQRTGVLMVIESFDKVSYALVMESTRPIKVNDMVTGI